MSAITTFAPPLIKLVEGLFRRNKAEPKNGKLKLDSVLGVILPAITAKATAAGLPVPSTEQIMALLNGIVTDLNATGELDQIAAGIDPPFTEADAKACWRKLNTWCVQP